MNTYPRVATTFVHAHVATELWLQIVVGGGWPAHAVMEDVIVRSRAAHGIISSLGSPRVQRLSARWNATVPVAFGEVEYDIDLTWRGGAYESVSESVSGRACEARLHSPVPLVPHSAVGSDSPDHAIEASVPAASGTIAPLHPSFDFRT